MEEKTPQLIYLDNNATTRVDPAVFEAMVPWLRDEYGNPSSTYPLGARASQAINEARANVAGLLGCEARDIIFTSCGTESINTAILSALALDRDKTHIITSAVEHSATIKLCEYLATRGYEITWLPVNSEGQIDLAKLESSIREDTALVSLLWANNETGVLFPIEEIARITAAKKVPLHVDAVQAAGKLPLNVSTLGAQFVSISGHKLHCPKGVGALYVSRRVKYTPLLRGSQEEERRGGTQNVASIVGLGKAAAVAAEHLNAGEDYVRAIRDHFENRVLSEVPGASRNGHATERLPNTANLAFDGIESEGALMLLADSGICCSAGSACTSGSVNPSHVLKAMGFSNDHARGSLRFSFGRFNTMEEADFAATEVARVTEKLRSLRSAGPVAMAS